MRFLLDTNIISDLIKNPLGKVAEHIRQLEPNQVCTTIIVAGELHYGIKKKSSLNLSNRVTQILRIIPILPLGEQVAITYGTIRADLERSGSLIGANDLWIAAHALSANKTLITNNVREFGRVNSLKLENWLE